MGFLGMEERVGTIPFLCHCIHDPSLRRFFALGWHFLHRRHAKTYMPLKPTLSTCEIFSLEKLSLLTAYM